MEAKPLKKTILKTGLGDLECTGTQGKYSYKKDEGTFVAEIQSLSHDKSPFGVARLAIQFSTKMGDREEKGSLTLIADKVSTGAKSELPASK